MRALIARYAAYVALGLPAAMFVAFLLERYPPEVDAAGFAAVFVALGFVDSKQAMADFFNPVLAIAVFFPS